MKHVEALLAMRTLRSATHQCFFVSLVVRSSRGRQGLDHEDNILGACYPVPHPIHAMCVVQRAAIIIDPYALESAYLAGLAL